ncbi:MAG: iron hydrogenase [Clostridiales bacterium]|nr:iron hydrogenase [Clostridiales bacterium]
MHQKHKELFKKIVKAYYNDNFEESIKEIMEEEKINKHQLFKTISMLCGVDLEYDENYIENLKKAISTYKLEHKIVDRVLDCDGACRGDDCLTNCQRSCPFDAILTDPETGKTYIDVEMCQDCGTCVEACENGHIMDKAEFIPFAHLLKENTPVLAAVAPAIYGQFGENVSLNQLRTAFKKIGFTDMFEVAFFADMLTLKEAVEFNHHVNKTDDFLITSCCCPMWVAMIRKIYNSMVKHVSPSVSPMIAAGRVLKKLNPEAKVVFIGPCVAKKAETKEKDLLGDIDFVLTFEELKVIFDALEINPAELPETPTKEYASRGGRLYGRTAGVSTAVSEAVERIFPNKSEKVRTIQAHGVVNCKELLSKLQNGEVDANFIEGMGCVGGCVGGPKRIIPMEVGRDRLNELCDNSEIKVAVDSDRMLDVLKRIGITSVEDVIEGKNIGILERTF